MQLSFIGKLILGISDCFYILNNNMTERILNLIDKFQPPFFDIPIDKNEMHNVVERLYCLMYPISSQINIESVHLELGSIANILLRTIAQLTSDDQADSIVEKFFEAQPEMQRRLTKDASCYLANDP